MTRRLSLSFLIVFVAVLAGTVLRVQHAADHTMSHVEMFVPGIPLTAELSDPKPRMDLWTVVTSTLSSDTHPPGYYVLMWFVTKCFGSGTLAIRLPSVVFGAASIGLLFWLGVLIGKPTEGCVAALFLALNGYHIVWSRTARMYTMACFLGLLTTILLLLLARSRGRRRVLEICYAALTLLGLSTHLFYWALLAAQMVWVLANAWTQDRPLPRILNVQFLVVILGSPLLAFAVYQSGNPVAVLSDSVPVMARGFFQFADLIPGWDDTNAPGGAPALALAPQFLLLRVIFLLVCVLLLIAGVRRMKPSQEPLLGDAGGSFTGAFGLAAAVGVLAIVAHIVIALHHPGVKRTLRYTEAMTPLPLVLAFTSVALGRSWDRLRSRFSWRGLKLLEGGPPLIWLLVVVPFALLATISVLVRPLMDQRGLLYLAPYLLLMLATGAVALGHRSRWLALSLLLCLGSLHVFSVWAYSDHYISPVDYKEFADKLKPHIQSGDLIFMTRWWGNTPILYYMTPDRYHLLASHYEDACSRNPNARVWGIYFRGQTVPPEISSALNGYREVESVNVYRARGVLYCRSSCR